MKVESDLKFVFDKETKSTYRFKESAVDHPPVIGTLYVQKWVFNSKPTSLTVKVSEPEATQGGGERSA